MQANSLRGNNINYKLIPYDHPTRAMLCCPRLLCMVAGISGTLLEAYRCCGTRYAWNHLGAFSVLQSHTLGHVPRLRLNGWKTAAERRPAAPSSSLTNKAQQIITAPIYTLGTNQRRTNVKCKGLHLLSTPNCAIVRKRFIMRKGVRAGDHQGTSRSARTTWPSCLGRPKSHLCRYSS